MKIKVIMADGVRDIECEAGESLLAAMKRQEVYVPAYCGGRGTCQKCGVKLVDGMLPVTQEDAKAFDAHALADGMRLSCTAYPQQDCTVRLCTDDESEFEILTGTGAAVGTGGNAFGGAAVGAGANEACGGAVAGREGSDAATAGGQGCGAFGVAVDIGTTTIAMELWGLEDGKMYAQDSRINHQRAFGADVISRIQASCSGEQLALQRSILNDLCDGLRAMIAQAGIKADQVARITIGANTTMGHLLLGYPCHTLGVSPFTPVDIDIIRTSLGALLEQAAAKPSDGSAAQLQNAAQSGGQGIDESVCDLPLDAQLIVLPGISTFVGADIVAGLLVCGFTENEKPCLLIDLGTNGEMAIGHRDRILCTSTAAGPAFEGGNISHGIGSVRGAICSVHMDDDGRVTYETIGQGAPLGICGTGVLDITAELVERGIVDETGLLDDDYFDDGVKIADSPGGEPIVFTQQDVREIQLAKAAVRAGIEVLLRRFGIGCGEIDTVYLAGGFGFKIDTEKAISIGLLPEGFRGKIRVAGNTSLKGARACLFDGGTLAKAQVLGHQAEEVSLGGDAYFNQCYMDAMCFENEDIG